MIDPIQNFGTEPLLVYCMVYGVDVPLPLMCANTLTRCGLVTDDKVKMARSDCL